MFTSKQRSNLKALANGIEPVGQIGKLGLTDNLAESFSQALEARELIKISVLKSADDYPESYAEDLADRLSAEVVCVIGRKIILYRKSGKEHIKHIEF
ncbi:MAG: YhbY family RNA-binding protein [Clostridia bacterium]|nr:YhbY family RNA-binding protein [Clostridia bacterium]